MKKITFKEMCETIHKADILRDLKGENPTPEQIFNYSPSGELYMIFEWYRIALSKLNGLPPQ